MRPFAAAAGLHRRERSVGDSHSQRPFRASPVALSRYARSAPLLLLLPVLLKAPVEAAPLPPAAVAGVAAAAAAAAAAVTAAADSAAAELTKAPNTVRAKLLRRSMAAGETLGESGCPKEDVGAAGREAKKAALLPTSPTRHSIMTLATLSAPVVEVVVVAVVVVVAAVEGPLPLLLLLLLLRACEQDHSRAWGE